VLGSVIDALRPPSVVAVEINSVVTTHSSSAANGAYCTAAITDSRWRGVHQLKLAMVELGDLERW
jgi:hypothetical protein